MDVDGDHAATATTATNATEAGEHGEGGGHTAVQVEVEVVADQRDTLGVLGLVGALGPTAIFRTECVRRVLTQVTRLHTNWCGSEPEERMSVFRAQSTVRIRTVSKAMVLLRSTPSLIVLSRANLVFEDLIIKLAYATVERVTPLAGRQSAVEFGGSFRPACRSGLRTQAPPIPCWAFPGVGGPPQHRGFPRCGWQATVRDNLCLDQRRCLALA